MAPERLKLAIAMGSMDPLDLLSDAASEDGEDGETAAEAQGAAAKD